MDKSFERENDIVILVPETVLPVVTSAKPLLSVLFGPVSLHWPGFGRRGVLMVFDRRQVLWRDGVRSPGVREADHREKNPQSPMGLKRSELLHYCRSIGTRESRPAVFSYCPWEGGRGAWWASDPWKRPSALAALTHFCPAALLVHLVIYLLVIWWLFCNAFTLWCWLVGDRGGS